MFTHKAKHILIAPLDWGLGHTSRCIPLIKHIIDLGHKPLVACNSSQKTFIEETFGCIDIIHLEGYHITFSEWNRWFQMGIIAQIPAILGAINKEHKWLKELCQKTIIDGIISDNRYGLFHPGTPSVILTHQLQVQTSLGNFGNKVIRKLHYRYLHRFEETWVVDLPGGTNLGGVLSHTAHLPGHSKYIGLLSRFEVQGSGKPGENLVGPLVILLSGPEPQRSILSDNLWQQVKNYKGSVVFTEGSYTCPTRSAIPGHITYHKLLTGKTLETVLKHAGIVICRSGYSTIMDLLAISKKAILIPTPGQTEQEYLAKNLSARGMFYSAKQNNFILEKSLAEASAFTYHNSLLQSSYNDYKPVLKQWILNLK